MFRQMSVEVLCIQGFPRSLYKYGYGIPNLFFNNCKLTSSFSINLYSAKFLTKTMTLKYNLNALEDLPAGLQSFPNAFHLTI